MADEAAIAEAVRLHREGRLSEAESTYLRILESDPGHAGVLHNLGVISAEGGKHDEAIDYFDRALAADPGNASAHRNRAGALFEIGRLEAASDGYRRALDLEPGHYDANFRLALVDNALGRRESALACFAATHRIRRAAAAVSTVSRLKLDHDISQLRFLARSRPAPDRFSGLAEAYDALSGEIAWPGDAAQQASLTDEQAARLAEILDRSIHVAEAPEAEGSSLGASLDPSAITREYFRSAPRHAVVDDLLASDALRTLGEFLLGSTIWFDSAHVPGFVAAYLEDGLACPLLLQIADDLRRALPEVFASHALSQAWAFKCVGGRDSVDVHLDAAAVSVNFWITPDSANLDDKHGGLVLYDAPPPEDWRIAGYDQDAAAIRAYLAGTGSSETIIPHRQNRAVIFDSNLFHGSDTVNFSPGYENHRINITLLFGRRAG